MVCRDLTTEFHRMCSSYIVYCSLYVVCTTTMFFMLNVGCVFTFLYYEGRKHFYNGNCCFLHLNGSLYPYLLPKCCETIKCEKIYIYKLKKCAYYELLFLHPIILFYMAI
jgi:hypothetical protein